MSNAQKAKTIIKKIDFWTKRQHSPINEMNNQEIVSDCRRLDYEQKRKNLILSITMNGCNTSIKSMVQKCGYIDEIGDIFLCKDCTEALKILRKETQTHGSGNEVNKC